MLVRIISAVSSQRASMLHRAQAGSTAALEQRFRAARGLGQSGRASHVGQGFKKPPPGAWCEGGCASWETDMLATLLCTLRCAPASTEPAPCSATGQRRDIYMQIQFLSASRSRLALITVSEYATVSSSRCPGPAVYGTWRVGFCRDAALLAWEHLIARFKRDQAVRL
jgi:hypothetical protein